MDTICCASCAHFDRDPLTIEKAIPGLNVMSSGFASVRDNDGMCAQHDRYVPAYGRCAAFATRRDA